MYVVEILLKKMTRKRLKRVCLKLFKKRRWSPSYFGEFIFQVYRLPLNVCQYELYVRTCFYKIQKSENKSALEELPVFLTNEQSTFQFFERKHLKQCRIKAFFLFFSHRDQLVTHSVVRTYL